MSPIPAEYALVLAAILFALGLAGLLVRRNVLFILISIEIMMNAAGLAFVAAGTRWGQPDGQVMFLFILAAAGAEVSVGLALVLQLYRHARDEDDGDVVPAAVAERGGAEGVATAVVGTEDPDGSFGGIAIPADMDWVGAEFPVVRAPGDHGIGAGELDAFGHLDPEGNGVGLVAGNTGQGGPGKVMTVESQSTLPASFGPNAGKDRLGNALEPGIERGQVCAEPVGLEERAVGLVEGPMDVLGQRGKAVEGHGLGDSGEFLLGVTHIRNAGPRKVARLIFAEADGPLPRGITSGGFDRSFKDEDIGGAAAVVRMASEKASSTRPTSSGCTKLSTFLPTRLFGV